MPLKESQCTYRTRFIRVYIVISRNVRKRARGLVKRYDVHIYIYSRFSRVYIYIILRNIVGDYVRRCRSIYVIYIYILVRPPQ